MKPSYLLRLAGLLLLLPIACGPKSTGEGATPPPPARPAQADLVLRGGLVYTVDPGRQRAQALAVRGDEIVFVGGDDEAAAYIGPGTRVVELAGRMVLPGFQDAHVHPVASAWQLGQCSLHDIEGLDAVLARIRECVADGSSGHWVRGDGWTMDLFPPNGIPDKALLDSIASDRPIALTSTDGHSLWANSRALAMAGIDASTPDPEGGWIDRMPGSGEPIGGLQESAMELVEAVMPPVTDGELLAALRAVQQELNALGITAVQDAEVALDGGSEYRALPAYRGLDDLGELSLRVVVALHWQPGARIADQVARYDRVRRENTRGRVHVNTVKIYQDGVMENGTAALLEPYIGLREGFRGLALNEPAHLDRVVTALDAAGFQVHFHAIGDRAIREALDALQKARETNGIRDARHHVSHLELIDPADIPRFARLDVTANFQPLWAYNDPYVVDLTVPKIGAERARWLYPIGSVLKSGGRIAFGSDWSVSSADPLRGIETAVTRVDAVGDAGEALTPEERIGLADAIAAYTIDAAWVNFLDDETGSLEIGKQADLVVLDRNLFELPPAEISDAKVVATLLAGRLVYGDL
jgi:predicted amidohydrolase YtcJ